MTEYITMVKELWFPIAISIILLYFLINKWSKKLDEIKHILTIIAVNVWKTLLNSEQTILIFKWCLSEHIFMKLKYAKQILIENDIQNRKEQIKLNLLNEFKKITEEEATKLSQFNTPAWDLWKILLKTDFNKFMSEVYDIFFSNSSIDKKCNDMNYLMFWYVNTMVSEIKDKIYNNTF